LKLAVRSLLFAAAVLAVLVARAPAIRADDTDDYINQIYQNQKSTDDYLNQIYQDQQNFDNYMKSLDETQQYIDQIYKDQQDLNDYLNNISPKPSP
jgi:septal ring factor EnvC (AmiA/AmiB activator)